jgi:hypothetical protein
MKEGTGRSLSHLKQGKLQSELPFDFDGQIPKYKESAVCAA